MTVRALWLSALGRAAVVAGTAVRLAGARSRTYPGILGALLVSVSAGGIVGHTVGHGLAPWVAGLAAGGFLLLFGREVNQAPKQPPDDTASGY